MARPKTRAECIDRLVLAIRKIVEERPSVRYEPVAGQGCSYIAGSCTDKTCGCLVGQGLFDLGFSRRTIKKYDYAIYAVMRDLFTKHGTMASIKQLSKEEQKQWESDKITHKASLTWLSEVQHNQDWGKPWAEAVKQSDDYIDRIYGVPSGLGAQTKDEEEAS